MTPEEAREIDRLEFEADCGAARDRAFALIAERHGAERARVLRWIKDSRPAAAGRFKPHWTPAPKQPDPPAPPKPRRERLPLGKPQRAFGMSMTLRQWADYLGISLNTLYQRMHKTRSLEAAIAIGGLQPTGRRPGVGRNLPALSGTGGGSTTQDFSEIEFSQ